MTATLIILGVIVLSLAFRTMSWTPLRKVGMGGFLAATFLIGYFIGGRNIWIGAGLTSLWFVFPWIEILTRTRKMRLPVRQELAKQSPPGSQRFPELHSMTGEIEATGFEFVNDTGWDWDDTQHFFRFFYHEEKRLQAAICFTQHEGFSWACVNLTTRHSGDKIYRSINIPFSTPMKSAPNVQVRRDTISGSFEDYLNAHEEWLTDLNLAASDFEAQDEADIFAQAEEESGNQIRHNLDSGIIALCDEKNETWRYSWRGLIYLYCQVLKDFVKWC